MQLYGAPLLRYASYWLRLLHGQADVSDVSRDPRAAKAAKAAELRGIKAAFAQLSVSRASNGGSPIGPWMGWTGHSSMGDGWAIHVGCKFFFEHVPYMEKTHDDEVWKTMIFRTKPVFLGEGLVTRPTPSLEWLILRGKRWQIHKEYRVNSKLLTTNMIVSWCWMLKAV